MFQNVHTFVTHKQIAYRFGGILRSISWACLSAYLYCLFVKHLDIMIQIIFKQKQVEQDDSQLCYNWILLKVMSDEQS